MKIVVLLLLTVAVALTYGEDKKNDASFLTDYLPPLCRRKQNTINCCATCKWKNQKKTMCVRISMNHKTSAILVKLTLDGTTIAKTPLKIGEVCGRLTGKVKKYSACLQTYFIKRNDVKNPLLGFEACFVVKVANTLQFRYSCVRLTKDGKLLQHKKIQPENVDKKGVIKNKVVIEIGLGIGTLTGSLLKEIGKVTTTIGSQIINIFG
uniref:Venom protein family 2 protein 15 n=1 Tax=Platymeris rhadamanthus TaxID=1134088 RepID=A0A6B9KZ08_PLARH|nr:venom protein family 2 protein 15 [Platymeris rhadamanthus]